MNDKIDEIGNLYRIQKEDIKKACNVYTRAFFNDPLFIHLFPSPKKRKKIYYMFYVNINYGLNFGYLFATSKKIEGVIMLLPPRKNQTNIKELVKSKGYIIPFLMNWKKPMKIQKYIENIHKRAITVPHWYLSSIAVDPLYQGKGFASKLLRTVLNFFDSHQTFCYLETENKRNISLYEHFGFEVAISETIPNSDLHVWGMIRKPK